jgi:hypothetical protein
VSYQPYRCQTQRCDAPVSRLRWRSGSRCCLAHAGQRPPREPARSEVPLWTLKRAADLAVNPYGDLE